jgi:DivIVA domain-containing protein
MRPRRRDDRWTTRGTAAPPGPLSHGTINTVITVVQYLVIAAVIGAVMFGIAIFVFGRGEQMAPLPARMSPVELPASDLRGDDVRHVRFGLALRGYRMSDVDWTLERLADELDVLHHRLDAITRDASAQPETQPAAAMDSGAGAALSAGTVGNATAEKGASAGTGAADAHAAAGGAPAAHPAAGGGTVSGAPTSDTADQATP